MRRSIALGLAVIALAVACSVGTKQFVNNVQAGDKDIAAAAVQNPRRKKERR